MNEDLKPFEIWGVERFRSANRESVEHLWAKVELYRRKRDGRAPWFPGEYHFEKKVADLVPDCFIVDGPVNRWIEVVKDADQNYWTKTRKALRLGFVIHWLFPTDETERLKKARQALKPELKEPFTFGRYNPIGEVMNLGDPITFKNFDYTVESMEDFTPKEIVGYRKGEAEIRRHGGGFDLGLFNVSGVQRRLISLNPRGDMIRAVAPGQSIEDTPWGFPTRDGLEELVDTGHITRLGPVRHRGRDQ
jgi:hypothetical protein